MKITIEPTRSQDHRKVTVEKPDDDMTAEVVVELVRAALLAYGFHPDTIAEAIGHD